MLAKTNKTIEYINDATDTLDVVEEAASPPIVPRKLTVAKSSTLLGATLDTAGDTVGSIPVVNFAEVTDPVPACFSSAPSPTKALEPFTFGIRQRVVPVLSNTSTKKRRLDEPVPSAADSDTESDVSIAPEAPEDLDSTEDAFTVCERLIASAHQQALDAISEMTEKKAFGTVKDEVRYVRNAHRAVQKQYTAILACLQRARSAVDTCNSSARELGALPLKIYYAPAPKKKKGYFGFKKLAASCVTMAVAAASCVMVTNHNFYEQVLQTHNETLY